MGDHSFNTINNPSEGLFKDKGSRFLSFAYPVKDEEEIGDILENLKKEYHDARHHCYAWRLGKHGDQYRANDDGEPSNSAGMPILGQLRSYELTNVLIVVVRYFGGTLLGVGGLIQAYKTAAREAIENARINRKEIYSEYRIDFSYSDMNKVMKILKDLEIVQRDQRFEMDCSLTAIVPLRDRFRFEKAFEALYEVELRIIKEESF